MTESFRHAENDRYTGAEHDERAGHVTLHEERLVPSDGTQTREIGQVRLRKRIVVEEITVTVPVRREVVDVVHVDADGVETVLDAAEATYEPRVEDRTGHVGYGEVPQHDEVAVAEVRAGGEDTRGVTCYEERPVITTELFAVERVRLDISHSTRAHTETHAIQREEAEVIDETRVGGTGLGGTRIGEDSNGESRGH